jgi:hypothetical protein
MRFWGWISALLLIFLLSFRFIFPETTLGFLSFIVKNNFTAEQINQYMGE